MPHPAKKYQYRKQIPKKRNYYFETTITYGGPSGGPVCGYDCEHRQYDGDHGCTLQCGYVDMDVMDMTICPVGHWKKGADGIPVYRKESKNK